MLDWTACLWVQSLPTLVALNTSACLVFALAVDRFALLSWPVAYRKYGPSPANSSLTP